MPVEFEEFKINKPQSPNTPPFIPGRSPLSKNESVPEIKSGSPILAFLIKAKLAKNEDYAKLILLIIIIIAFTLAFLYSYKAYNSYSPEVINTAPINFDE